jgi:oxygen-dependent protoporphyrinogen oxidase
MTAAPKRIVVIGGGIAGLAAAHRLLEIGRERGRPFELRVLESAPRLGGSIATERRDGFVIEAGPDSLLSEKPAGIDLCERLGLAAQMMGTREEFRRTYVVRGGRLQALPDGFLLLAPTQFWPLVTSSLFSWSGKLRMALDLVLPRGAAREDESLSAFVGRRLGREALERVAQPLVGGIYTADPDRLSLAATMPRFLEMERQHRSIILAMLRQRRRARAVPAERSGARWSLFVSFRDGMQTLVDTLAARLPGGAVETGRPVRALSRDAAGGWQIDDARGCDAVILATPAPAAARLLDPVAPALAAELRGIPYASSATVSLAYRREDVPHPLDGFGFVVPAVEQRAIVACTFSSLKYAARAPAEFLLLRAFVGGALHPERFAQSDDEMVASVCAELHALLGVRAAPRLTRIHRHPESMAQYHVGHLERLRRIEDHLRALPGLHLAGSAYRGVGIPDCIRSGEDAAAAALGVL